ncbi:MAG: hypothetical protein WA006_00570 [Rhodoglobus sp.]
MSIFEQRDHVFVDESKSRGYVLAAATVSPEDAAQTDKDLRGLTRPGQSRIHFKSESAPSRRSSLSRMSELDLRAQIYVVRGRPDREARALCLRTLVSDLANAKAARLIIEHDYLEKLGYEHAFPSQHAMLWVSDAVAWCHQAGGEWIKRAAPLVGEVIRLG